MTPVSPNSLLPDPKCVCNEFYFGSTLPSELDLIGTGPPWHLPRREQVTLGPGNVPETIRASCLTLNLAAADNSQSG